MTASVNSKAGICNLALSRLGNYGTINNIDIPSTPQEVAFALVYDIIRQDLLTLLMPNFACKRRLIPQMTTFPAFGWSYQYEYPSDCLRVLGIGEVQDKENTYSIEGGVIMTNDIYTGLPLRFVQDIEDISQFSPQFINTLALHLADATAYPITQDKDKAAAASALIGPKLVSTSATNAQENRPVRKSTSRFKMARYQNHPHPQIKR